MRETLRAEITLLVTERVKQETEIQAKRQVD